MPPLNSWLSTPLYATTNKDRKRETIMSITIPADVPLYARDEFRKNYRLLTRGTGNLFLFAADHKIEHLDKDFQGPAVDPAAHDPHHLFSIAGKGSVGAMATQLGLIARYGNLYPDTNYIAKLNSKTNIIPRDQKDPCSTLLWSVQDVMKLKNLTIPGIGITVYLGSEYEDLMLHQAAQAIFEAHQQGLVAILWVYPRGKAVKDETDPTLLAGAVGVANALGADFVKIHAPTAQDETTCSELLRYISQAAGNTKVIIAGGTYKDQKELISEVKQHMKAGISGAAIGRSLFQHSLKDAIKLSKDIFKIIYTS